MQYVQHYVHGATWRIQGRKVRRLHVDKREMGDR